MTLTALQAAVSKTAVFNGSGVDISGVTGDFTVILEITSLTANAGVTPVVLFALEDSVDAFTNKVTVDTYPQKGALNSDNKQHGGKITWRKRDLPTLRAGTTSAVLRVALTSISGTGTTVGYKADLQIVS